jgi:hypothetical protein
MGDRPDHEKLPFDPSVYLERDAVHGDRQFLKLIKPWSRQCWLDLPSLRLEGAF